MDGGMNWEERERESEREREREYNYRNKQTDLANIFQHGLVRGLSFFQIKDLIKKLSTLILFGF